MNPPLIDDGTGVSLSLVVVLIGAITLAYWRFATLISTIRKEGSDALADYKLHVAETYMTKASGSMAIDRAVGEIRGLRKDLREDIAGLRSDIKRIETEVFTKR